MHKMTPRPTLKEVNFTYTGYVVSKWDSAGLKVLYFNRNMCWSKLGFNTLVFQTAKKADQVDIPKAERKMSPTFLCKVFVVRYKSPYSSNKYTLTKHNYWHKLEEMMNI